jgi:uncharacterized protein YraI
MKLLGVVLAGAAALLTLVNLPGPTGAAAASIAAGGGNLRSGPGLGYQVITTLPEGELVTIQWCKKAPAWCRVSTAGYSGWLSASRLAHESTDSSGSTDFGVTGGATDSTGRTGQDTEKFAQPGEGYVKILGIVVDRPGYCYAQAYSGSSIIVKCP